ncbi:MAG: DUF362 domain-containing protein [Verrucomicrobiota bacterium]|nr:DUF362 domain-containing protein [Verrucomicrobiota bacterium]
MLAENTNPSLVAMWKAPVTYTDGVSIRHSVDQAIGALQLPEHFISPGNRVVLKPNWVKEHDERHPGPNQWEHVVTHPIVIEAVALWAGKQLNGTGEVIICDAPQTDSSFTTLRKYCALDAMIERCRAKCPGVSFVLLDLRPEEWHAVDGVVVSKTSQPGDPLGQTHVRLDAASEFVAFHGQGRLYGASYDMAETNERHAGERHEYMLCRTPMDADVFINLPKLKTHKKVGLTCALKNLVGINANKNWLPHHTEGTPEDGGDQFPKATTKARLEHSWMGSAKRLLKNNPALSRLFVPLKKIGRLYFGDTQEVVRSGNWHGNDTCWRMVLDLNKCLFYFDGAGARRSKPIRYLAVVDGIIGGEGNGPMAPDARPTGAIIAGTHPTAVDTVAATLMGFDPVKIRLLSNTYLVKQMNFTPFKAEQIEVISNHAAWRGRLNSLEELLNYKPHFGWVGAIENSRRALVA